ncbi:MAG: hypothetical protein QMD36_03095 [Candidatus Aenigmarchaeota archaeon]|nr:hypothetical protein [Candidatus Aenigmarchaeota archaeon]
MKEENKKVITVFSIASFLNDMGSDMTYPIWPLCALPASLIAGVLWVNINKFVPFYSL